MKMLDLSKFEKVKEDKNTTTMRHSDGHEMTILHAKLPKIHREQLKRLKMAKGGVAKYDEGTPDNPVSQADADNPVLQADANPPADDSQSAPITPEQVPQAENPALDQLNSQTQSPLPIDQNLGNPTSAALTQQRSVQLAEKAANLKQQIDTAQATGNLQLAKQAEQNAIAQGQRSDQTIQDMKKYTDNFANDTTPINPNAMYQNMSVPAKIGNVLGLLLGGFTGGFNGTGNNPAMNYLKDQQEKDIQAQKDRFQQQKTVWGAYNTLYNNENVSTELAKKSWNDRLAAQANQLTAQLGTATSKYINMQVQSKILNDSNDHLKNAAWIIDAPASGAKQPAVQLNPEMKNGKPAYGPESADSRGIWTPQPMIHDSDADLISKMAYRAQNGDGAAAADLHAAQDEFKQGKTADNIRSQAPRLFGILHDNATRGGQLGHMVAGADTSAVPVIGPLINAVGSNIGSAYNAIPFGNGERSPNRMEEDYNTAAKQLEDNVGIGIGPSTGGERTGKTSGILSDISSDPENISKHMQSYDDLITSRTRPFTIEKWRKKLGYQ